MNINVVNVPKQEEYEKLNYVESGETVETTNKPVDMILYGGKIYILSATTNSVDIFNPQTNTVEKNVSLNVSGFSNKINPIKNSNLVIITNVAEKKYVVFDLERQMVLQTNPIDLQMTTLTVVNKTNTKTQEIEKKQPKEKQMPVDKQEETVEKL